MIAVIALLIILFFVGLFIYAWVKEITSWYGRRRAAKDQAKRKAVNLGY